MAGRAAAGLSRRLGRGGGTVIAGHLVPRIAPRALWDVTRSLTNGSIVVSGTNGKTTTTRLISHILRGAGMRPIHNRAGANLLSGLFTAIAEGAESADSIARRCRASERGIRILCDFLVIIGFLTLTTGALT